mmetsp:Transcript_26762/g.77254  ORF Transcript_26762/g.77254 Transcript_26762/m.77254 type:complete len:128 (-) Transcript_26762:409-792(-)
MATITRARSCPLLYQKEEAEIGMMAPIFRCLSAPVLPVRFSDDWLSDHADARSDSESESIPADARLWEVEDTGSEADTASGVDSSRSASSYSGSEDDSHFWSDATIGTAVTLATTGDIHAASSTTRA